MPKLAPWILRYRFSLAAVLLVLALPFPASAGVGVWTPLGPDGGSVQTLAVHPRSPQIVFAGTGSGVFRSTDAGRTWVPSSQGMGPSGWSPGVRAVKIDPLQPDNVYAVSYQEVWKSRDGGRTWSLAVRVPNAPSGAYNFTSLAIDPKNPRRLYLGSTAGLLRSLNAGGSWQKPRPGTAIWINHLAVDPQLGWVYAGTEGQGLLRSQDGGVRWTALGRGLPATASYRVLEAALHRGRALLFAATESALFRSEDHGQRWARVGAGTLLGPAVALAFDTRTARLYAGTVGNGIWASGDRGATWRPASSGLTDNVIQTLATGPGAVYAGLQPTRRLQGLFKSTDAGASWSPSQTGMSSLFVPVLAASPSIPGLLLAGVNNIGLLKSRDTGRSWQLIPGLPEPLQVYSAAFDPAVPATVYASAGPHLVNFFWRSDDQGATWQSVFQHDFAFLRLWIERGSGTLWGVGPGLWRSDDRGTTWTAQPLDDPGPSGLLLNDVKGHPVDSSVLYAAGFKQVGFRPITYAPRFYRSTDGGGTWQRKEAGLPPYVLRIAVDPADPAVVYAAGAGGLFRSRNGGDSWETVLSVPGADATALLISATVPQTLSVVVTSPTQSDLLQSRDDGRTWARVENGLGDARPVIDLVADPHEENRIYAATTNGGVFSFEVP